MQEVESLEQRNRELTEQLTNVTQSPRTKLLHSQSQNAGSSSAQSVAHAGSVEHSTGTEALAGSNHTPGRSGARAPDDSVAGQNDPSNRSDSTETQTQTRTVPNHRSIGKDEAESRDRTADSAATQIDGNGNVSDIKATQNLNPTQVGVGGVATIGHVAGVVDRGVVKDATRGHDVTYDNLDSDSAANAASIADIPANANPSNPRQSHTDDSSTLLPSAAQAQSHANSQQASTSTNGSNNLPGAGQSTQMQVNSTQEQANSTQEQADSTETHGADSNQPDDRADVKDGAADQPNTGDVRSERHVHARDGAGQGGDTPQGSTSEQSVNKMQSSSAGGGVISSTANDAVGDAGAPSTELTDSLSRQEAGITRQSAASQQHNKTGAQANNTYVHASDKHHELATPSQTDNTFDQDNSMITTSPARRVDADFSLLNSTVYNSGVPVATPAPNMPGWERGPPPETPDGDPEDWRMAIQQVRVHVRVFVREGLLCG
jgi:hypothetical protein